MKLHGFDDDNRLFRGDSSNDIEVLVTSMRWDMAINAISSRAGSWT